MYPTPGVIPLQVEALDWLARLSSIGALRAALLLIVGIPATFALSRILSRWAVKRYHPQAGLVVGKLVFYPLVLAVLAAALATFGVSVAPLLGAAGVLGIALGFASQTSVSNVISGLFLIGEQPFVVDDAITVGSTTGRVLSVGTLSVQLRTFDNRFVRIPNETLIKSEVVNLTRFPIRRMDINIGITYSTDSRYARDVLLEVAAEMPKALTEPEPQVWFDGFGESSIDLRLSVWTVRESYGEVKNEVQHRIKARFDERGIDFAFPHRALVLPADGVLAEGLLRGLSQGQDQAPAPPTPRLPE